MTVYPSEQTHYVECALSIGTAEDVLAVVTVLACVAGFAILWGWLRRRQAAKRERQACGYLTDD